MIADKLRTLDDSETEFEPFEEEAIISIALDSPDYFVSIHHLLHPDYFALPQVAYVINELIDYASKHQTVPRREALLSSIKRRLTTDNDYWDKILEVVERPASYRDLPMVRERLDTWVKRRQITKLYSKEGQEAYARNDFTALIDIVEGITKFNQTSYKVFDLVDDIDQLFVPDNTEHISTGFHKLDKALNNGGPSPGETLIYMGPTNVGKSIFLCNTAMRHWQQGQDTLLVTFELDNFKTARRVLSPFTGIPIDNLDQHQSKLKSSVHKMYATNRARLKILEWPPDECSIDDVFTALQNLKRRDNFVPRSIVLDYMDLMMGRREADNKDDYTRQKYVATQLRNLAKRSYTLVTTATQTNRAGNDTDAPIGLNKAAESYGKTMSADYIVTLNQKVEEHASGKIRLWIAKNRNGPKNTTIECDVNYNTLCARET